jgi:hypothetical protein
MKSGVRGEKPTWMKPLARRTLRVRTEGLLSTGIVAGPRRHFSD